MFVRPVDRATGRWSRRAAQTRSRREESSSGRHEPVQPDSLPGFIIEEPDRTNREQQEKLGPGECGQASRTPAVAPCHHWRSCFHAYTPMARIPRTSLEHQPWRKRSWPRRPASKRAAGLPARLTGEKRMRRAKDAMDRADHQSDVLCEMGDPFGSTLRIEGMRSNAMMGPKPCPLNCGPSHRGRPCRRPWDAMDPSGCVRPARGMSGRPI